MYTVNDTLITIPRGDTAQIAIKITDAVGSAYTLSSSEKIQIDVYSVRNAAPIITERSGSEAQSGDTVTVALSTTDTSNLSGAYQYLIRLINTATNTVDTLIQGALVIQ